MRLLELKYGARGGISLTGDLINNVPAYAILSHTWGADEEEVTFDDLERGRGKNKLGWEKIRFCGEQARQHGLQYVWVDTCCINKANHTELSEAITSMCRWYRDAAKCYVYLSDVSAETDESGWGQHRWGSAFRQSRWFTRGWTLQELLAPASVEFFSREGRYLGCKKTLEGLIHEITQIPVPALQGQPFSHFSVDERLRWTTGRNTKKAEDKAYCLLGIFDIFMPLIYGEGKHAFVRLKEELKKRSQSSAAPSALMHWLVPRSRNPLFTGRDAILRELDSTVCDAMQYPQTGKQCRIVITGMGGQGKSEISLQFAYGQRHRFWAIFWIDVSTRGQSERSFLDIADKLSLSAKSWEDARLGITNLKSPWLLVLDNADDPDRDYQQYFPDSPLGVVILASRNNECQQYATAKPITLEGLSHFDHPTIGPPHHLEHPTTWTTPPLGPPHHLNHPTTWTTNLTHAASCSLNFYMRQQTQFESHGYPIRSQDSCCCGGANWPLKALNSRSSEEIRRVAPNPCPPPQGRYVYTIAHQSQQLLTIEQENELVRWILTLEADGYAPTHITIREMVAQIARESGRANYVGKKWVIRFLQRHPEIHFKTGRKIDAPGIQNTSPAQLNAFFERF